MTVELRIRSIPLVVPGSTPTAVQAVKGASLLFHIVDADGQNCVRCGFTKQFITYLDEAEARHVFERLRRPV